jgi:hypothetical protein
MVLSRFVGKQKEMGLATTDRSMGLTAARMLVALASAAPLAASELLPSRLDGQ